MARRLRVKWAPGEAVTARLEMPPQPHEVGVLLAHGAGAGQMHPFMESMRQRLGRVGFPTLTFDYSYMSAGRRAPDRIDKLLAVHRAAADRLMSYVDAVVLAGKSMGGRVGSHLAGDEHWPAAALVYYGYPLVPPGKSAPRSTDHLRRITVPQLFVSGTRDRLAPLAELRPVVESLPRARLHEINEGDHSFKVPKRSGRSHDAVLDELTAATADWVAALSQAGGT